MSDEEVSSQAITKYGIISVPSYVLLDKHTDLNLPPSNWLKDNLAGKFSNKIFKKKAVLDHSSLFMADRYPNVIGEVDIISSAEHIKKLLKMPFSKSSLSLTVHRIGKTLLLNDLDIPALMKSEYHKQTGDLQWLHDLYCSATNQPKETECYPKKRSKQQTELSMMESKFMYYSIEDEKQPLVTTDSVKQPLITTTGKTGNVKQPLVDTVRITGNVKQPLVDTAGITGNVKQPLIDTAGKLSGVCSTKINTFSEQEASFDCPAETAGQSNNASSSEKSLIPSEQAPPQITATTINELMKLPTDEKPAIQISSTLPDDPSSSSGDEIAPKVLSEVNSNYQLQPASSMELNTSSLFSPSSSSSSSTDSMNSSVDQDSYFLRDVLWTFEDLTMLVGSDLPIFGGGRYPAVSLRLRDSSKPISILTGIDYWLDNLMCNVPELIMCFHLKGIVQRYEQIKTTDLPNMEGSSFSPKVIKDVAQNILSFLKTNCTKEGHTYWLFKSNKEEVIKLYDLTSICASQGTESKSRNPFSVSVAILLYRIAQNMFSTGELTQKNISKAIKLLQHCAKLLENENQVEMSFLANFLIVEFNVQLLNITRTPEDTPENSGDELEKYSTGDEEESEKESVVKTVSIQDFKTNKLKNIEAIYHECVNDFLNEEEKAKRTLSYSINALKNLQQTKLKSSSTVCNQATDMSLVPTEVATKDMSVSCFETTRSQCYTRLHKEMTAMNVEGLLDTIPNLTDTMNNSSYEDFYMRLRDNLLIRIANAYVTLIKIHISLQKYGRSLRFIKISCYTLSCVTKEWPNYLDVVMDTFMYYGDILTVISNQKLNVESELDDFVARNVFDMQVCSFLDQERNKKWLYDVDVETMADHFYQNKTELLKFSVNLYEQALALIDDDEDNIQRVINLTRRLGNVRNELGVSYMNDAASLAKQYGEPSTKEIEYWKKSFSAYEGAVQAFEVVDDKVNQALVYANMGRLMCLCAQVYGYSTRPTGDDKRSQFSQQEKTYFHKSFEYYQKALSCLQVEKSSPRIWYSVNQELSNAYFLMASVLQDYPPLTDLAEEMVLKEISSALMKVLQYAEPVLQSKFASEQRNTILEKIGLVHERLASLYHNALLNQLSDHGKRNYRSLAELHYKKVYSVLNPVLHSAIILRVFVLHSSLLDYALKQNMSSKNLKAKLDLFLSQSNDSATKLKYALQYYEPRDNDDSTDQSDLVEVSKSLFLIESHLSKILKEAIKYLSQKKNKTIDKIDVNFVKALYEVLVRNLDMREENLLRRIKVLGSVVEKLQHVYNKDNNVTAEKT